MKRYIRLVLLLLLMGMLSACGKKETTQEDLSEGEYFLYYTNVSGTKLGAEVYTADQTRPEALADELIRAMQETPKNMKLSSAIPEAVRVLRTQLGTDRQLFVYFNAGYNGMEPAQEILCRAAVVKTLTQIDGVEYVGFYVNDQPLMDAENNAINLMTASSFVENTGSDTEELQRVELILYYANEEGTALVKTTKSVVCSTSISTESLVVDQLIKGPGEDSGVSPVLPSSLKVLQVAVRKGICYVNLDSAFTKEALNVSDYIPVYAIVDSLTELPNISKVQISVDGSSALKFRDSISLEQPLERKLDYVKGNGSDTEKETTDR